MKLNFETVALLAAVALVAFRMGQGKAATAVQADRTPNTAEQWWSYVGNYSF